MTGTLATLQPSFASGELSPSLYGRVDLAKYHAGAATMRNFFVNYRGGASSRAGTMFIGQSKQSVSTGYPPRLIPFQFSLNQGYVLEFGGNYMRIIVDGGYVVESAVSILSISNANPGVVTLGSMPYAVGDWVVFSCDGMTQLNNMTCIVAGVSGNTLHLTDVNGNAIDTTTYAVFSSGTMQRIYTLTTPWASADIGTLKYTQSADTMTIVHPSYPPYDLARVGLTNWTLTEITFDTVISPPSSCSVTSTSSGSTEYAYCVTAVDLLTGQESIASPIGYLADSVCIDETAGSITVSWSPVSGAGSYNVFRAPAGYNSDTVPAGSQFGYVGTAFGTSWVDANITPDYTTTPPQHQDPFAPKSILYITMTAYGSGYNQTTTTVSIKTSTGSGAVLTPIVVNGELQGAIIQNGGTGYSSTDTVVFTDSSGGSGAVATLAVSPSTGTYPSTVAYFQQRRWFANSNNDPNTFWASRPGAYTNMDSSVPSQSDDAIVATIAAQQVNGINWMIAMPGGLVMLTGQGAWQLSGGSSSTSVTPSSLDATPQAYNGCCENVQPIVVDYDILYVQSKGSIARDLSYNFFANIYTGTDMTVLSNHLFDNHLINRWAWAEEPYKLVWAVRDDGILLCFTYLKSQDIYAWTRHDTNGLFIDVCVVAEPPVNAPYFVVQRFVNGNWVYYIERMNNRLWGSNVEDAWCVDAALAMGMPAPAATLSASSATGNGNIGSVNLVNGGTNYANPVIAVVDSTGTGATFSATVEDGVITAINILTQGSGYTSPVFSITDSTGSGFIAQPVVANDIIFTASADVFSAANVGSVIRMGGGIATINAVQSPTQVSASLTQSITATMPNDPNNTPIPAASGSWSMTAPVTTLSGLDHLNGMTVAVLADGNVVPNQIVSGGSITLPSAASAIIVGLPFQAQLISMYLDTGTPTIQGKRKDIYAVTVRMENGRGVKVGTTSSSLVEIKERSNSIYAGSPIPLYTGDERVIIPSTWQKMGQIIVQQDYPLPVSILGLVNEYDVGDS